MLRGEVKPLMTSKSSISKSIHANLPNLESRGKNSTTRHIHYCIFLQYPKGSQSNEDTIVHHIHAKQRLPTSLRTTTFTEHRISGSGFQSSHCTVVSPFEPSREVPLETSLWVPARNKSSLQLADLSLRHDRQPFVSTSYIISAFAVASASSRGISHIRGRESVNVLYFCCVPDLVPRLNSYLPTFRKQRWLVILCTSFSSVAWSQSFFCASCSES